MTVLLTRRYLALPVTARACNELMVLGFSGALAYFGPLQPLLGVVALLVLMVALRRRIRDLRRGFELPSASTGSPAWRERV